jgi:hypothetical protein
MSPARRLRGQVGKAANSVTLWLLAGYAAGSAVHGFSWGTLVGGLLMLPLGALLSRAVFPYLDRRAARKRALALIEGPASEAVGVRRTGWESSTLDPITSSKDS